MGMAISFGLGHTLLALEAYFLRNWRYLALVACSPAVIIIFFYFVFNESVRWLLSRGRHKEAKRIITKAARVNKVKLEEDTWERLLKEGDEEKQTKTHSQLDLFRTWKRTVLTFKLAFCRLSFAVAYYGLALNAQGLGGNIYLNFALLGAADLPIVVLSSIILDKTGRRKLLVSTLFFGGLACIASGLIPKEERLRFRLSFAVAYYGLALNAQGLGGNIYLNFALLGAADLPIVVLSSIILDKTGRRKLLVSTLFFGGLACIASGLIPKDFQWLAIVSAVAGKMLICAAGALNDLVVSEVFPTVIRHTGLSFCVSFGRMGGVLASQILFLKTIYQPLPFIILGSLAITGGFVSFFLPETRGKPLLQTLEAWDIELNGRSLKNQAQQDERDADEVELENMKSDQIATG
ncbi:organic cation transporter-like protein [Lingula anatina]|uniref:Organic cation transporter-like protein n=1 Tax=Lingula anatina TaxID=7574 RepID=A0A2R2MI73_LINAN|nr:organic cation transporter-like protein [Lingula anatina]|eukprot:XP_023929915.1 organic cation transporter-like protein [Lingula anatina]